jgi:hypothetical protein
LIEWNETKNIKKYNKIEKKKKHILKIW